MAVEHLQEMSLDVDRVMLAVRFLEAYAETCRVEIAQTESLPARPDQDPEDTGWVPGMEAATALRDAGQWMLFVDPHRARDLLAQSGDLYRRLGYAYGTFLLAATGWTPSPPTYELFGSWIPAIAAVLAGHDVELPAPLRHPQQQAYAALASAGQSPVPEPVQRNLEQIIRISRSGNGVAPVGALGTPVRSLWEIADNLLHNEPTSMQTIVRHLEAMALRYRESMKLAQVNDYLWTGAAAPVDVGDLDIAGIAAIAARLFGRSAMESALFRPGSPLDDLIARAPIDVGLDLAIA